MIPSAMHILLSNDDGYFAPGLLALYEALQGLATLTVVAPERDRSGASHSLTLDRPLSLRQNSKGFYYVNGTPTDCVHLAVSGLLKHMPDMVISGINHGANMGDDTVYSGTVAAATEGYMLGLPSIAVSLVGGGKVAYDAENVHGHHFETAGRVVRDIVLRFQKNPWPNLTLLNINVPDLPFEQIHTIRVTRLGRRHKSEPVISTRNPRNEEVFWIGPPGPALDADDGTDFHALEQQEISITPLRMDLTDNEAIVGLGQWLAT